MQIAAKALAYLLFNGVAVQAFIFYLVLMLIPFIIYWQTPLPVAFPKQIRKFAYGIFLMWVVFPISNLIDQFCSKNASPLNWSQLLKSHFSTVFLFTSFSLLVFSLKKSYFPAKQIAKITSEKPSSLFQAFLSGLLVASVLECLHLLFEQKWGMNFLGQHFKAERLLSSGLYRVPGFYSHPLTLAAVGLTYLSFVSSLFFQSTLRQDYKTLVLLVLSAYSVFASGGRCATVLAILLLLASFYKWACREEKKSSDSKQKWASGLLLSLSIFILLGFLCWQIGLWERFTKFGNSLETERFVFWRVHWQIFLDHPWFGQSFAALQASARDQYYQAMGLGQLTHKYSAHNFVLELLSNIGLLGIGVLCFGAHLAWQALKALSSSPQQEAYRKAILFALAVNFINSLTQNVFFDSSVMYIYFSFALLLIWDAAKEKT